MYQYTRKETAKWLKLNIFRYALNKWAYIVKAIHSWWYIRERNITIHNHAKIHKTTSGYRFQRKLDMRL